MILKALEQHALNVRAPQFKVLYHAKHVFQESTRKQELLIALTVVLGSLQISLIHQTDVPNVQLGTMPRTLHCSKINENATTNALVVLVANME
jgi:hypothetical protein